MSVIYKNEEKVKANEIYQKFQQGISKIISEMKLKNPKTELRINEIEKIGVDYHVEINSKDTTIRFWIRTETNESDLNKFRRVLLSIEIWDESRPYVYSDSKWFEYEIPVSKWVTKFFHRRNIETQDRLNYILSNHKVKFVGRWGISTSSANLFEIMLEGALQNRYFLLNNEKLPILRIRHFDENGLRLYTYIILLEGSAFVFPAFCGPDSGEGGSAYERVENNIKKAKKKKLIVYDLDIEYDKFKEFAVKHMSIDTFNNSISIQDYDKYIKIFKEYLNNNIMSFEIDQNIENKILEELKNIYPKSMGSTELSKKINEPVSVVKSHIFYLEEKNKIESIENFKEIFVKMKYRNIDNHSKGNEFNFYGPTAIGDNSNNIITINSDDVRNQILSSHIEGDIKKQILEKIGSLEKEAKNQKPNINKMKQIKIWFEKIKSKIPADIYNLIIRLSIDFIKKQTGL